LKVKLLFIDIFLIYSYFLILNKQTARHYRFVGSRATASHPDCHESQAKYSRSFQEMCVPKFGAWERAKNRIPKYTLEFKQDAAKVVNEKGYTLENC
jgi:hypothetical protein